MKTTWYENNTTAHKKEINECFIQSERIRNRLVEILSGRCDSAVQELINKDMYLSPNWAQEQADRAGYARALQEVINLLKDS